MTTSLPRFFEQDAGLSLEASNAYEPDLEWTEKVRKRIEVDLAPLAVQYRDDRDRQAAGLDEDSPEWRRVQADYDRKMAGLRRGADERYLMERMDETANRALGAGVDVDSEEFAPIRKQQQAIMDNIQRLRTERPPGRQESHVSTARRDPENGSGERAVAPSLSTGERDVREGGGFTDRYPRSVVVGPAPEYRPRDRTQSGGSHRPVETPGGPSTPRPPRSRGNSSAYGDWEAVVPTSPPASYFDPVSLGRQSGSSLSRTRPSQDKRRPADSSPLDGPYGAANSRTWSHATARAPTQTPSPISPVRRDAFTTEGRTISRSGSVRSTERPSFDAEPAPYSSREGHWTGAADDVRRPPGWKGKDPERVDGSRLQSVRPQRSGHDIYSRGSRPTALPISPAQPVVTTQPFEESYPPSTASFGRFGEDAGVPIRSQGRTPVSPQGSPEIMRYVPPGSASSRPIPPKRSFNGEYEPRQADPSPSPRSYYSPPSAPALGAMTIGRPIPRAPTHEDDISRHSPSSPGVAHWHGSQSPPTHLSPPGSASGYRYTFGAHSRRNSNGSRSLHSQSSKQDLWLRQDDRQTLPTFEEQSIAGSSDESEDDYGMGMGLDFDGLTYKIEANIEPGSREWLWSRQEEVERKAAEAQRKAEEAERAAVEARKAEEEARRAEEEARREARRREEEIQRKAEEARKREEEIRQREEDLRRRELELAKREYEAMLQAEVRKRQEAEAKLEEERRRREREEEERKREREEARRREEEQTRWREETLRREREREEADRRRQEEIEKIRREESERRNREREDAERRSREEAERLAREEAEMLEQEEMDRSSREEAEKLEAERREHEAAAMRAQEEEERREREAAKKKEREEAEKKEKEEVARVEAVRQAAEAERRAREEAKRQAEAEARARNEAKKREKEEAKKREREATVKRKQEEAERREREVAERRQREEREKAERTERARAEREEREKRERADREELERAEREEQERAEREERARAKREEEERLEREEAQRREKVDAERRRREREREEALRAEQEAREAREQANREARARQEAETKRKLEEEAESRRKAEAARRLAEEEAHKEAARIRAAEWAEARRAAEVAAEADKRDEEEFLREQQEAYQRIQQQELWKRKEEDARKRAEEDIRRKEEERQRREDEIFAEVLRKSEQEHREREETARRRQEERKRQDSVGSGSDSNRPSASPYSPSSPWPIPNRAGSAQSAGDRSSTASSASWTSAGASIWSSSSGRSGSTAYTQASTASRGPSTPTPGSSQAKPPPGWKPASSTASHNPSVGQSKPAPTSPLSATSQTYAASSHSTHAPQPMDPEEWARRQEEQAKKQFEQFQREQEQRQFQAEAKALKQMTKEQVISLFEEHDRRWSRLPSLDVLTWHSFPWPMLRRPAEPEQLTYIEVQAYVLSPHHPGDKAPKERVKDYLRRWHPDRFETKLLPKVREDEREKVKEGAGAVARNLNKLLSSLSEPGLFG